MKDTPSIADVKIKMMRRSIDCLIFGLLGLLPFVGPPFALAAGWFSGQARSLEKYHWNPAHQLRIIGMTCAVIGVLVWTIVDIIFIWHLIQAIYG